MMSQTDVVIDLLAGTALIIVLVLLYGGVAPSKKPDPQKQNRPQKKQNRLKMILDKEAQMEQQERQKLVEAVRPDLIHKIEQYTFIQELLSDAQATLEWKRATIEPYEGWCFVGSYMQPNEYAYVYGYALHQYKVQKYVDRKLRPNNTYAVVSKKRTYHRGVALVAAKRRSSAEIKLYIAEYDSPSEEVNIRGHLCNCRLIETLDKSTLAYEEATLKALKEYVKQNRGKAYSNGASTIPPHNRPL